MPVDEEMERLRQALAIVRREVPGALISVDTFRADVARMCIEEGGAHIINDISGGALDGNMFRCVAQLGVPYILMHMQGTPGTMQLAPHYDDLMREVFLYFSERILTLRDMGVKDIILDPGFGFGKTLEHNYELMGHLGEFREFNLPLLVGISRKSMIYKTLDTTPDQALTGTTALHWECLRQGSSILRVHDTREAIQVIRLYEQFVSSQKNDRS